MGRRRAQHFSLLAVLLAGQLALLTQRHVAVEAIENKCSACFTVASELLILLSQEKPRNHLDMRHRLDSRGVREGKVIDYKVSELRAVEILDQLCAKVKPYHLMKVGDKRSWVVKADSEFKTKRAKMVADAQGKELARWCDRLIEEKEEEFTRMIQNGQLSTSVDIEDLVCRELTTSCPKSEGGAPAEPTGDGASKGHATPGLETATRTVEPTTRKDGEL